MPDDAPRYRFVRYVRPPVDQTSTQRDAGSLFPLRPNTRKLRVAADVQTLGEPTPELLRVLARDEEVEPLLLVQNEEPEPTEWMQALGSHRWYQFTFTTVAEAPRFADSSTVGASGYEDGRRTLATSGHFFSVYARLTKLHALRTPMMLESPRRSSPRFSPRMRVRGYWGRCRCDCCAHRWA